METATQTYRGYRILVGQDPRGAWHSTIRRIDTDVLVDKDDDQATIGPFLTAEAACREAEWQVDLRVA